MSSPSPSSTTIPQTTLPPTTLAHFRATHPLPDPSTDPTTTQTTTYHSTSPEQALEMHTRHTNMVETRTTKPTLMTRLRGRHAKKRTVTTTTEVHPAGHHSHATTTTGRTTRNSRWGGSRRTAEPVVHHKRHASLGDKISGAMLKLKGSLTHRPGVKAAGTRRMHGTDGRGSHRVY